jgi:hypothetical protein
MRVLCCPTRRMERLSGYASSPLGLQAPRWKDPATLVQRRRELHSAGEDDCRSRNLQKV